MAHARPPALHDHGNPRQAAPLYVNGARRMTYTIAAGERIGDDSRGRPRRRTRDDVRRDA